MGYKGNWADNIPRGYGEYFFNFEKGAEDVLRAEQITASDWNAVNVLPDDPPHYERESNMFEPYGFGTAILTDGTIFEGIWDGMANLTGEGRIITTNGNSTNVRWLGGSEFEVIP